MKNIHKHLFMLILLTIPLFVGGCACERIDAGHEGIKVKLYGDDKGVQDVQLVTGMVWYNPLTENVYEYPTFVSTIDYASFNVNAKDGSVFSIDPTLTMHVTPTQSPFIFKKYRRSLDEVLETSIFNYVKESYRIELNKFSTDYIISNRQEFENAVETKLRELLTKEGFTLVQLSSGLGYPESIVNAIDMKNRAVQEAMRVENELKVAQMQARKTIIEAEAEYKANQLKQQSLTPLLIQKMFIEKWNGNAALYGNSPMFFKQL